MIFDWLTPVDYAPQQNDFLKQRQAGTGQWLLDSKKSNAGWRPKNKTLFFPGIPGAGKTVLTSIIVKEIQTRFYNDGSIAVAYLYCNFNRQSQQKLEDLLASLLKQLAQIKSCLPENVESCYNQHKKEQIRPSVSEYSIALQSVVATYSRVFILVDALDECQVDDCRTELLSALFDLWAMRGINLFATSRFIPEITYKFQGDLRLEIHASQQDVQRYVDGHISKLPKFIQRNPILQKEISIEIIKAIDGMYVALYNLYQSPANFARFLLVQLHLNSLRGTESITAVRGALRSLPTGSDAFKSAYHDTMARIERQLPGQVRLAKRVLSWINSAKRPLTTSELRHGLATIEGQGDFDKDNLSDIEDIVSVCARLVTIDQESNIIRLVHYTTQEYFEQTQKEWFPTAEFDITAAYVTYLLLRVFGSGVCHTDSSLEERLRLNPLYDYAARYWGYHACQASNLHSKVIDFMQCTTKLEAATQAMLADKSYPGSRYSQIPPRKINGTTFSSILWNYVIS